MSIHSELKSNLTEFEGYAWRVVEGQYSASTMKLANSLEDQEILEDLLEESKPQYPEEAYKFDYLIATPFRYFPYPQGSRFRRAGQRDGVFYSSLEQFTAIAELAFYRLLFWRQAEGLVYPEAGCEHTAFQVTVQSEKVLDLTKPPFGEDVDIVSKSDYSKTQAIADAARSEGVEVLISRSVRCPHGGTNINILSLDAFKAKNSNKRQSWTVFTRQDRVIATSEFPKASHEFLASDFDDPRLM
jgi:hypothetical protein